MPSANHRARAIFGGSKGPSIGAGCDIYISDRCNENCESGSNFGGSYQLPFGLEFGTKKARGYLAGMENFVVSEYEVLMLVWLFFAFSFINILWIPIFFTFLFIPNSIIDDNQLQIDKIYQK